MRAKPRPTATRAVKVARTRPKAKPAHTRLAHATIATGHSPAKPSPARDLQYRLNTMLTTPVFTLNSPDDRPIVSKWAFKWTVLGLAVICGAFWVLLAQLIF